MGMSPSKTRAVFAILAIVATGGVGVAACSSTTETTACDPQTDPSCVAGGDAGDPDAVDDDSSVPSTEVGSGPQFPPGSEVLPDGAVKLPDGAIVGPDAIVGCTPGSTQCTNCVDDDGDGLVDWLDPECTGPLDNDEGSFATGIPGDNVDPCKQDCWFDGNSGSGNDGCLFNAKCLPGSKDPKCPYDPAAASDPKQCPKPTDKCVEYCKPLTPKGCDCAGCCQVFDATGKAHTVKLTSTCTTEKLGDPAACPPCTQIADCSNPCGRCDYCLGKTTLPDDCFPPPSDAGTDAPAPPPSSCPDGMETCSPTKACPDGKYCLTGCCVKPPA